MISLSPATKAVVINNLVVNNAFLFDHLAVLPETERERAVRSIIELGTTAANLLRTSVDAEFIERKFGDLATRMNKLLDQVQEKAVGEITKRFSPTESGSYTKHIGELIHTAKKELDGRSSDFAKAARDLLDPEKKSSAVGQLASLLQHAEEEFDEMFDPDRKGSYTSQLSRQLDGLFGADGRPGTIAKAISELLKPVVDELRALKEKVGEGEAARKVAEATPLKGFSFEGVVERRLGELARPYGDAVVPVGTAPGAAKSGDFIVDLNGSKHRITVEARNGKVTGPSIKHDLKKAMTTRGANFGILVVRSADLLPEYIGRFQIYEHQIVVDLDGLEAAYRVARVILESESAQGDAVDTAAIRAKLTLIKDAVAKERNIRTNVTQVENAASNIRNQASEISNTILTVVGEIEGLLRLSQEQPSAA